ncbi:16S rRNA (guanine(527)-N(7))-methyltransferase RsmG [Falsiruegeria litorea]|uniref:Ribosomal RNA small subunit methyltransferase G n=2 Tax=Roseobacteraceae TaxID=2854170 RepID=A0ABS5WT68_9RHOB|nr:16S rRNA (guanine(527)-N(7))-methyltransferase RsmG [Falsiruegeria litorea]MBT8168417.1 16S rRNA (guanine(527)-N(7))-methyltransferase RsmG [Falsiruegeria litorea]
MNITADSLDVSRETFEKLEAFDALLKKWNPKINLVSRKSLADVWVRHISDSLQVYSCLNASGHWVDLGSGGGFPGVIVAIVASVENPGLNVTLVESDQRKSAFLRTVLRETVSVGMVITDRIENIEPLDADILSARALSDLPRLLEFSQRHLKSTGIALFPKGATWKKEVEEAKQEWNFDFEAVKSVTEPSAVVLKIKGVELA